MNKFLLVLSLAEFGIPGSYLYMSTVVAPEFSRLADFMDVVAHF